MAKYLHGETTKEFNDCVCELVFNTAMTGYLGLLTDAAYAGQGIVMTYPLIGNYGIALEDKLSENLWPTCFIVHELSKKDSNFRSNGDIITFLEEHNIPTITEIDTRKLAKILRKNGTMKALITVNEYSKEVSAQKTSEFKEINLVEKTSCKEIKHIERK